MTTTTNSAQGLPIAGLEDAYDCLAEAIDRAGKAKAEIFLVKLALLNANAMADNDLFRQQIETALHDL